MKRLHPTLAVCLSFGSAALSSGQSPAKSAEFFRTYCVECHGETKPKAGLNLARLLAQASVGPHADDWDKVVAMLETAEMPPADAKAIPTELERTAAAAALRTTLHTYARAHAGEPGRVTVRRLTSGEYAYAIRDLTGLDLKVGLDSSADSVGGEGFTNFGDVQFMQDASVERYLEAAKQVAAHAIIGAGPLQFFSDPGRTGLELSALHRINALYAAHGFRVVSGEGGLPYGLERYSRAFFVAWFFQHRVALGEPQVTLRDLAAREGITGRFAEHVWSVVKQPALGYPSRDTVARWQALPTPTSPSSIPAAITQARAGCDDLQKNLTTWPSWFFGRGDAAAGGAGDESPLMFDDQALAVEATHPYTYPLGFRFGRGGRGPAAPASTAPIKVVLNVANINPLASARPVVIWRNPRVITRSASAGRGRSTPGAAASDPAAAETTVVAAGAARVQGTGDLGRARDPVVAPASRATSEQTRPCAPSRTGVSPQAHGTTPRRSGAPTAQSAWRRSRGTGTVSAAWPSRRTGVSPLAHGAIPRRSGVPTALSASRRSMGTDTMSAAWRSRRLGPSPQALTTLP